MKIIQQEARPGGVTDILTMRNENKLCWQGWHKLVFVRLVRVVALKSPSIAYDYSTIDYVTQ